MIRPSGCIGKASRSTAAAKGSSCWWIFSARRSADRLYYTGPDMKSSHRGLGITLQEWEITLQHIAASLDALRVSEPERVEFMAAAESLKWDIVEEPSPVAAK